MTIEQKVQRMTGREWIATRNAVERRGQITPSTACTSPFVVAVVLNGEPSDPVSETYGFAKLEPAVEMFTEQVATMEWGCVQLLTRDDRFGTFKTVGSFQV